MTITSSPSHDTSTTTNATGIVIGHQQHHNSPSAFAANNCIRQENMQAQEDSSVQITWSPSMLSTENPSLPPFLSSSTSLPTRSTINNNENGNTGKSTVLGATLNAGRSNNSISNTQDVFRFLSVNNVSPRNTPTPPLSSSSNTNDGRSNNSSTSHHNNNAELHDYSSPFDVIYSSIDANEGANSQSTPSSSLAPWESTQPQTPIVRGNDDNHHRHRESNNNLYNRSQQMHNAELPYSGFARQDHIADSNSAGGHDNGSPVVVTSAPWLQPSLWTNDSNENNQPYSSSTDSHLSTTRQHQDNTFTLDLLDGPLSSLVSSPKKQDASSYPPRQRTPSYNELTSESIQHHHTPTTATTSSPSTAMTSFRPHSNKSLLFQSRNRSPVFDNSTASATTSLFQQNFLSKGATPHSNNSNHANNTNSSNVAYMEPPLTTSGKLGLSTAKYLQNAAVATWLRPHVQSYLLSPDPAAMGERTVVILTGKVAQKSYGSEKRFLCPPPTVIFDGASWWCQTTPPKLQVSMSGETSEVQEGQVDWFSVSGTVVGQTGFRTNTGSGGSSGRMKSIDKSNSTIRDWYRIPNNDPLAGGKCVLRQLYINDADEKRKRVECVARIQFGDGTPCGTISSKPIKVISKPSKKRSNVKNTEACIHHGSTVSLFNRIRSQTVSTKYLGVSSSTAAQPFMYPGQSNKAGQQGSHGNGTTNTPTASSSDGTCFIARTASWDPFVIWTVDTNWVTSTEQVQADVDEYIGPSCAQSLRNDVPYPPPPAIAAKNKTGQPLAVHYNQHIVLQCLTTGLVSPVMIIRKVDRAATVVGGANTDNYPHAADDPQHGGGGEYGDEILGDPVSQLHKVALQIVQDPASRPHHNPSTHQYNGSMLPRTSNNGPATYLACLNDMVGMHRSVHERKPIRPVFHHDNNNNNNNNDDPRAITRRRIASTGSASSFYYGMMHQQQQRPVDPLPSLPEASMMQHHPHQQPMLASKRSRSVSIADDYYSDRQSMQSTLTPSWSELGAYWYEEVSDSAVWSIVGTEYARYTLWEPSSMENDLGDMNYRPASTSMIPNLLGYSRSKAPADNTDPQAVFLSIHGEYFTRELDVWFGDIRSPRSEYRGRELILCQVPSHGELTHAIGAQWKADGACSVPLLLVRSDGKAVYKTNKHYTFC